MDNVDIYNINMCNSRFSYVNLNNAIFQTANILKARFTNVNMSSSVFGDSNMGTVELSINNCNIDGMKWGKQMSQDYNLEISRYIEKFEDTKKERLVIIRDLIHKSVPEIKEKIWARIPSFYIDKEMVQFLAFKEHINIFANQIINYKDALSEYKITDKGTLQIYDNQDIPIEILRKILIGSVI